VIGFHSLLCADMGSAHINSANPDESGVTSIKLQKNADSDDEDDSDSDHDDEDGNEKKSDANKAKKQQKGDASKEKGEEKKEKKETKKGKKKGGGGGEADDDEENIKYEAFLSANLRKSAEVLLSDLPKLVELGKQKKKPDAWSRRLGEEVHRLLLDDCLFRLDTETSERAFPAALNPTPNCRFVPELTTNAFDVAVSSAGQSGASSGYIPGSISFGDEIYFTSQSREENRKNNKQRCTKMKKMMNLDTSKLTNAQKLKILRFRGAISRQLITTISAYRTRMQALMFFFTTLETFAAAAGGNDHDGAEDAGVPSGETECGIRKPLITETECGIRKPLITEIMMSDDD
jgi:hypothetical protein